MEMEIKNHILKERMQDRKTDTFEKTEGKKDRNTKRQKQRLFRTRNKLIFFFLDKFLS
jgi:hypothetical protein